jgi:hypothetical protein
MASDTVNLVIINNQGTAIHSSRHPGKNQKYMLETEKLGKGLFYWKVLVNEEIVMVGRMIIE